MHLTARARVMCSNNHSGPYCSVYCGEKGCHGKPHYLCFNDNNDQKPVKAPDNNIPLSSSNDLSDISKFHMQNDVLNSL